MMKRIEMPFGGETLRGWCVRDKGRVWVHFEGETFVLDSEPQGRRGGTQNDVASPIVRAPMPGKVTKVLVQRGEEVEKGQVIVMMEAMKMEYSLKAAVAGEVSRVSCSVGDVVTLGQELIEISSSKES